MKKNYITILLISFSFLTFSQTIENIAGNGTQGFSGDNGNANNAELNYPRDMDFDNNGNIYITDSENHLIRKVDINGIITTVAGSLTSGYSGDGGLAIDAQIHLPMGIKIDPNNNIYFIDNNNHCIRMIDDDGIITTIAGNGTRGFSGDGGLAINALLGFPRDLTIDSIGNIYITDTYNRRIRKINTNGIISTIAGTGGLGSSGDGGPAVDAHTEKPADIHIDSNSNIYFSDWADNIVRKIDNNGIITTIAGNRTQGFSGDGGLAVNASLNIPSGLTTLNGNLYITDRENYRIRKIDENGVITTYAGGPYDCETSGSLSSYKTKAAGSIISNNNNLYVVDPVCSNIVKIKPVGNLSIDEYYTNSLNIFPNPVLDVLSLKSTIKIEQIEIYNFQGKKVFERNVNKTRFKVNIENLTSGIYILRIKTKNIVESIKLLKK